MSTAATSTTGRHYWERCWRPSCLVNVNSKPNPAEAPQTTFFLLFGGNIFSSEEEKVFERRGGNLA